MTTVRDPPSHAPEAVFTVSDVVRPVVSDQGKTIEQLESFIQGHRLHRRKGRAEEALVAARLRHP